MSKYIACTISVLMLLLTGCQRDNSLLGVDPGEDGEETTVYLRIKEPQMDVVVRSGMTPEQEQDIKSIFIFIFDQTGKLISSIEHASVQAHADATGKWNPLTIQTTVGNSRDIYAIANYDAFIIENIKDVSSLQDLKNLQLRLLSNPLNREFGLIKVGCKENVNIRNGNTYDVELTYVSAKITLNVINKCPDLVIDGWTVDGLPLKTYAVERDMNPDNINYHDAVDINDSHDFFYSLTDQSLAFDEGTIQIPGDALNPAKYSVSFYSFENRRGGRIAREVPPNGWPNGDADSGTRLPYQEKSWYAPQNAIRVRILGQDISTKTALIISHYLGENNTDDYNIFRSVHYTYNITINGLNNIDIDTNVEQYRDKLSVRHPPELMNIDAHASMRVFKLYTDALAAGSGKVDFEVLTSMNTDTDRPTWVKIAAFPMYAHHVRADEAQYPDIAKWQQDGAVGNFVRPKFIPHKSVREKLANQGNAYVPPAGVILGSEDYPEDDDALPYFKAVHRMCSEITDIPIRNQGDGPANIYVYTDEFEYDNDALANDYREAVIRITFTPTGGNPEYRYYTLRQYRPLRFITPPGESDVILVERSEEFATITQTAIPLELQGISGLQWGPYDISTDQTDGYGNTLKGIYTTVTGSKGNYTWGLAGYLPKYGSGTGGWPTADNGKIHEPANESNITGYPFYRLNTGNNDYYNALYNTTAARYCHEKNWDINGDGNISPQETVWYLPSLQELQLFWTYNEILGLDPVYYWSSTQSDADNAYAISMRKSSASPGQVHNGVTQSLAKLAGSTNPPKVRCIRRASGVTSLTPQVFHNIDNTTVIDCSNMPGSFYTNESKMNIVPQDISSLQKANVKVYKKFEVERQQKTAVSYEELYSGHGKCNAADGWRLPTQREMLLMWSVKNKLEENSAFEKFINGKYWTMLRSLPSHYVVDFSTGLSELANHSKSDLYYRCVRELK